MEDRETDFWQTRRENKESAMLAPEEEQVIESSDIEHKTDTTKLLFDIKEQLYELNCSIGTIGEMFGNYLLMVKEDLNEQ